MNIIKILKDLFFILFFSCALLGCQLRKKIDLEPIVNEISDSDILFRTLNGYILFNEFDYYENDGLQLSLFVSTKKDIKSIYIEKITLLDAEDNIICSKKIDHRIALRENESNNSGYFSTIGWITLKNIQESMNMKGQKKLFKEIKKKKKVYVQFGVRFEEQYDEENIVIPFLYSLK